jgi:flagellin-specific chaperone FliS
MNPYDAYKTRDVVNWTRIEMLIALYDQALRHMHKVRQSDNELVRAEHRLKALRIVAHLRTGLDPRYGELPRNLGELFDYVAHCLADQNPQRVAAAISVLSELRGAFDSIRGTAIELESRGAIASLDYAAGVERIA